MPAWRYYLIGKRADETLRVYAPSLGEAFHMARLARFGSATITCFGATPTGGRT